MRGVISKGLPTAPGRHSGEVGRLLPTFWTAVIYSFGAPARRVGSAWERFFGRSAASSSSSSAIVRVSRSHALRGNDSSAAPRPRPHRRALSSVLLLVPTLCVGTILRPLRGLVLIVERYRPCLIRVPTVARLRRVSEMQTFPRQTAIFAHSRLRVSPSPRYDPTRELTPLPLFWAVLSRPRMHGRLANEPANVTSEKVYSIAFHVRSSPRWHGWTRWASQLPRAHFRCTTARKTCTSDHPRRRSSRLGFPA